MTSRGYFPHHIITHGLRHAPWTFQTISKQWNERLFLSTSRFLTSRIFLCFLQQPMWSSNEQFTFFSTIYIRIVRLDLILYIALIDNPFIQTNYKTNTFSIHVILRCSLRYYKIYRYCILELHTLQLLLLMKYEDYISNNHNVRMVANKSQMSVQFGQVWSQLKLLFVNNKTFSLIILRMIW